ncbi:PrsW family intramembrane metalloprotease, partial [Candidatus Nomurabacteria bacterium]|nr:PrsW family intramembrane metalloprotease [Candidatus Nomurabacteria bacterium]
MEHQSINNILVAIASGIIPALVWLWFWLKEDDKRPEPKGLLFLAFLGGMIAVPLVLPIQEFLSSISIDDKTFVGLAAASEEILKFLMFIIIILPSGKADEPIDFPIYFITIALGFSALENSMFLFDPITTQDTTVSLLTGGLRFLGASILHTISSAAIGIGMGLGF